MTEENNKKIADEVNFIYQKTAEVNNYISKNLETIWDNEGFKIYLSEIESLHYDLIDSWNQIVDIYPDYEDKKENIDALIWNIKTSFLNSASSIITGTNQLKSDYTLKLTNVSSSFWINDEKLTKKLDRIEKEYKNWIHEVYRNHITLLKKIIKLIQNNIALIKEESGEKSRQYLDKEKKWYQGLTSFLAKGRGGKTL